MAIVRNNSFHLMLSDDELSLLKLLAEREGLSASDYLRTMLRRLSVSPPGIAEGLRVRDLLGELLAAHPSARAVRSSVAKRKKAK
jgi:hypothetical protein